MPAAPKIQFAAVLALRLLSSSGHAATCAAGEDAGSCQARSAPSDIVLLQRGPLARTKASAPLTPHMVTDANATAALAQQMAGSHAGQRQSPFSALDCANIVPLDGNSIWAAGANRKWWSCAARPDSGPSMGWDVRTQGAGMCVSSTGKTDYTSIVVDMATVGDPIGCFAWVADQCTIDLRRVKQLEFDVDLTQCENLWAAPVWLSPLDWRSPQGLSGEVDFVEMCPVPAINTNLGCYSFPDKGLQDCMDGNYGTWGTASNLGGPKHLTMKLQDSRNIDAGGDLDVQVCSVDGSNCKTVAHYTNYLSSVYPTAKQQNGWPFELRSDVWNGYEVAGDGGWGGCHAVQNPSTQCKYVIKNIKVTSSDGSPMFWGKCAAMNA